MKNIRKSKVSLFWVWIADSIGIFLSFFFRRKRLTGTHDFPPPFFIIGCGRSGNTLLRSILVANDQLVIPPESYVWPRVIRRFGAYGFLPWDILSSMIVSEFEAYKEFTTWEVNLFETHQSVRKLSKIKQTLSHILHHIYSRFALEKGFEGKRWGDKTPINTIYANKILKVFPEAQFVFMERDPRDVVCSYVKAGLYENYESPARFWRACKDMSVKLQKKLPADQLLFVKYEDLVRRPEQQVQQICDFLGIKYSPELLNYWQKTEHLGDVNYRAHHEKIKSPISSDSIGKWEGQLTQEDLKKISEITNVKF